MSKTKKVSFESGRIFREFGFAHSPDGGYRRRIDTPGGYLDMTIPNISVPDFRTPADVVAHVAVLAFEGGRKSLDGKLYQKGHELDSANRSLKTAEAKLDAIDAIVSKGRYDEE